jgi:glutaredoxin
MINSETPYKLADIIRDTWAQLYISPKSRYTSTESINTNQNQKNVMKFTVYSKNGCPYCTKIKQVLELANLDHVVYNLNVDFDREGFYAQFGQGSTFPQIVLNDEQNLGGCTETVKYLKEQKLI